MGFALEVPWILIDRILNEEGRYVIIIGKIGNQEITIVGIYAVNWQQASFWDEILFGHLFQIGGF